MNAQFQSLFENVCRCFGHTPTSRNPGGGAGELTEDYATGNNGEKDADGGITQVNSEASSVAGRRRTNKLKLNDKQYDELFDKVKRGSSNISLQAQQHSSGANRSSSYRQPPRPEGLKQHKSGGNDGETSMTDHDTAEALAQAKRAANPPRYRTKRKRSTQTREEIFRDKNGTGRMSSTSCLDNGAAKAAAGSSRNKKGSSSFTPTTDFARLLNPSLALCFATPIRGTEEELEEQDLKSLDHSDTATLNTNGDDTITSTLYFDSKYAHIQESTPPMPLFSQFKIGQAKDEIRTIMATDSHSSVRMIKIMEQNQQHEHRLRQKQSAASGRDENRSQSQHSARISTAVFEEAEGECSSASEAELLQQQAQKSGRSRNHLVPNQSNPATSSAAPRRSKETIKITSDSRGRDEEMEDAVPDVKPISSSTDSSRLSNAATRHTSIQ